MKCNHSIILMWKIFLRVMNKWDNLKNHKMLQVFKLKTLNINNNNNNKYNNKKGDKYSKKLQPLFS